MSGRIYLSSPDISEAEEAALVRALRSGWVAPLGPEVDAFEAELADFTGGPQAVALSSGTAAIHLGLLSLGVDPGSVVVTSSMTFARHRERRDLLRGPPSLRRLRCWYGARETR